MEIIKGILEGVFIATGVVLFLLMLMAASQYTRQRIRNSRKTGKPS